MNKFPQAKVFTSEVISKTRVAIFENGEYICQLRPNEVSSWLHNARRATEKHANDEAAITVQRIINALEYIAARALRTANNEKQLSFF